VSAARSQDLQIEYVPVNSLSIRSNNARTHSKRQVRQIADSIKCFGFTNPTLITRDGTIIAGHGRVEAAKLLGMGEVPTITLEDLSPDQIRAYVIADNRLAQSAGWDKAILSLELQHLLTIEDFDIRLTGFEVPEIDLILQETNEKPDEADVFEVEIGPPITKPGDVWELGKHRICCGSALQESTFSTLLGRRRANVVFTDPPYNVAINGNVCGKGSIRHREFPMASGEMSEEEFTAFLTSVLRLLARFSAAGSVHFICMDWRHIAELLDAGRRSYVELLNLCVWVKNNGGMGSFYRSRHELVSVFRNGERRHLNNIQLGRFGRNRTNVWEYPGVNTMSKNSSEGNLLALHPTVKPVALVADALLDCSDRGDLVFDSFLGSGSTLIAAERVGRTCYGIEIDPQYVDVAIRRWQQHTGDHAVLRSSSERFNDISNKASNANQGGEHERG
jgi:DNA modification methylase